MATSSSSSFRAFIGQRCPRCHQGRLFTTSAWHLRTFDEMPAQCPHCGQFYEPELGFYWGAMYVSYLFSVLIVAGVGVGVYWLGHDPATWVYVTAVAATSVLFIPLSFRYARTTMLYLFGGATYNPLLQGKP
jgi:uncharacterized protein (DUF983 family)